MINYSSKKHSKFCIYCTVCSYTSYTKSHTHATANFCSVCSQNCPITADDTVKTLTGLTSSCVPILPITGNSTGYYFAPNCVSGKITLSVYSESSCMRRTDIKYKSVSGVKLDEFLKRLNDRKCTMRLVKERGGGGGGRQNKRSPLTQIIATLVALLQPRRPPLCF